MNTKLSSSAKANSRHWMKLIKLGIVLMASSIGVFSLVKTFAPQSDTYKPSVMGERMGIGVKRNRASSHPDGRPRDPVLIGLLDKCLATESLLDPCERGAALQQLMTKMELGTYRDLLEEMFLDELNDETARALFDAWASTDPKAAAAWSQALEACEARLTLMSLAVTRWAAADPTNAAAWAHTLPSGEEREGVFAALGNETVWNDPVEALHHAEELTPGSVHTELIGRAVAEWASNDRDGAYDWAKQVEVEKLRESLLEQLIIASAEKDPLGAADLALQMPPGANQDRILVSIIQRWVQSDPSSAAAWVAQFPPNTLGIDAMENLIQLWAASDLTASGNWVLTLPPGALRHAAITIYARGLVRTDAALAQQWADLIQ